MKNPIKILQEEHTLLLQAIKTGKDIQKVDENKIYYNLIHDFIIFIRNFTEIYHHPKEELFLYPLLKNRTTKTSAEFIDEICDNHEDFKALMADIENCFVRCDYKQLKRTFNTYLHDLRLHIINENKIVLNIAEKLLSENELKYLSDQFDQHDNKYGEKDELIETFYKVSLELS